MSSYIPAEDHAALAWLSQFSAGVNTTPYTYAMSPADAAAVASAVLAFSDALAVTDNENTRTKANIITKDDTRASAEQVCRRFAMLIKNNPGISDADKVFVGVRPINTSREPIHVPATSPILNIQAATPGSQTLRYADSMTPDTGKKPFGAMQLQLFMAVTAEETDDVSLAKYYGAFTKNPIAVEFSGGDDGKLATYFGRWIGKRGDVGPWSLPISMRIAA